MNQATLKAVAGFTLVTADLDRLVQFYRNVLGFAAHGPIGKGEMTLLGLTGAKRRKTLSRGDQTLWIDQFEGQAGPASQASDVAATRVVWRGGQATLISDPDGRLRQVQT